MELPSIEGGEGALVYVSIVGILVILVFIAVYYPIVARAEKQISPITTNGIIVVAQARAYNKTYPPGLNLTPGYCTGWLGSYFNDSGGCDPYSNITAKIVVTSSGGESFSLTTGRGLEIPYQNLVPGQTYYYNVTGYLINPTNVYNTFTFPSAYGSFVDNQSTLNSNPLRIVKVYVD